MVVNALVLEREQSQHGWLAQLIGLQEGQALATGAGAGPAGGGR